MKTLPKQYDPKEAEPRLQKQWEAQGVHAWDESQPRENTFVIDTPPPTVSGLLHMGHIFSYTQADFVARYQRMKGKTVFYPMGFDDNGLPTERLVEKSKKVRATDMSREAFIKLCEDVGQEARTEFRDLFTSVALSVDWKQEYHTVSDASRRISQLSFLDLFTKGHAYRKLQPMFWDPVDQTAIAQAEIVDKEMASNENIILFGLTPENEANPNWESLEKVKIMTTRPELLGACVALVCHPDDAAKYKGKKAVTPLFHAVVPIIADDKVNKEKGTGLVMCCTFGDETDIAWWREHKLDTKLILNKYGKVEFWWHFYTTDSNHITITQGFHAVPKDATIVQIAISNHGAIDAWTDIYSQDFGTYRDLLAKIDGKKVSNPDPKSPGAREIILDLLKTQNILIEQKPITHTVKTAERSGAALELLPTHQWFVAVLDKKEALKAKAAECNWYPQFMKVRMDQWIDGLSWDWCISRQRYFGVPFPIWYSKRAGEEGKILIADASQLPVNPLVDLPKGYTREEVDGEPDVMDTWATSSVSPQISAHGINKETALDPKRFEKLFPADLRPQAHEIIRTWAFYTVVKAHLHGDTIPWKNLMISGWCLAADKTKMSKSKGNVVTPVELIRDKGADAVRYWASTSRLGADTAFSEDLLKIGKKLVTKLWNATSFAAIHLEKINGKPSLDSVTETLDKWILSRLSKTVKKATEEFEKFEYSDARVAIEEFFWKDFCDNYLELVKARAYGEIGDAKSQGSAHVTLYYCLDAILRLFAPLIPHVTEELYSHLFEGQGSVHRRGSWPVATDYPMDETAEVSGIAGVGILEAIRKAKSERNVSIKFPIKELGLGQGSKNDADWNLVARVIEDVKAAGSVEKLQWVEKAEGVETEDKRFTLAITFGEQADVA